MLSRMLSTDGHVECFGEHEDGAIGVDVELAHHPLLVLLPSLYLVHHHQLLELHLGVCLDLALVGHPHEVRNNHQVTTVFPLVEPHLLVVVQLVEAADMAPKLELDHLLHCPLVA